jgi:Major capsid protein N-terminus/Large eukaryotic DNA virus major capsid protein
MGGGLLQLVAYGAQDAYISGNPHITFWKVLYKRHTNFAMEAFRVNFTGKPSWGQRLVAVVNRNADLMYKTYLEVVLPDTSSIAVPSGSVYWTGDANRRLGYVILKKIEVEIGGQIIDTHYGEWLFLWENLTSCYDNSVKLDSMVGGNIGGSVTTQNSCGGRPGVLYIPLQFWFCRNPGLALPLIALQYHEVRLNFYMANATDLVSSTGYSSISAAAAALPNIQDMSLYIDYIYLDVEERRRFAQQSHEYLIDQLQYGMPQTITSQSTRIDLTLNHPVKELVWVFQDVRKTDCASALTAATGYTQPFSYDDIVSRCRIQINGQDRFSERYGDYFWKVQPYQHHSGGAFWPSRQKIASQLAPSTGTFNPAASPNSTITGFIVNGNVLVVTAVSGAAVSDNMLITGTNVPGGVTVVANGSAANINGTNYVAGTGGAGTYLISTQIANIGSAGSTATFYGVLPDITFPTAFNPINVYSFALQPEEHQPSGTCNFSRIDTTTLVFDSITTGGAARPSKSTPFMFRIYAVNYNIFRVMSGMGGLAYSN